MKSNLTIVMLLTAVVAGGEADGMRDRSQSDDALPNTRNSITMVYHTDDPKNPSQTVTVTTSLPSAIQPRYSVVASPRFPGKRTVVDASGLPSFVSGVRTYQEYKQGHKELDVSSSHTPPWLYFDPEVRYPPTPHHPS
ncbi:MAG: hypothetical protein LBJ69_01170 [Holosporales bacterium]|jgi:hypothetical protein|nr:hypothetical protein [Holosporales bacterium]